MSCHASSMEFPESPSPLISTIHHFLLGYILCPHRAAVDKFQLVVQYLLVCVKGFSRAHHLQVCPYFSSKCPACLVCLIWMVLEMEKRWPYSSCFVGCCFQDLFITTRSIFVQLLSSLFFIRFVSIHMVDSYSNMDTTAAWKKLPFYLLGWSDLHIIDRLSIAVYAFASHVVMTFSVDEMLPLSYVNLSMSFRDPPFSVEISSFWFWLKHMYSILSALM